MKHIIVRANNAQRDEWQQKPVSPEVFVEFAAAGNDAFYERTADIYFDLDVDRQHPITIEANKPVFINSVIQKLNEFPANVIRINAWDGFLQRDVVEIASLEQNKLVVAETMKILNWKYQLVPDTVGMITPRIISMIINEAYYALGEEVSSVEEIDIAMRLGTNYPYGPFEWARKIGLKNIYYLLRELGKTESRCTIAPALEAAISA